MVISKLRIALEFKMNGVNVVGSYVHAISSLAFFIRPDKMNSFAGEHVMLGPNSNFSGCGDHQPKNTLPFPG